MMVDRDGVEPPTPAFSDTFNNLQVADGCISPSKHVQARPIVGCVVGRGQRSQNSAGMIQIRLEIQAESVVAGLDARRRGPDAQENSWDQGEWKSSETKRASRRDSPFQVFDPAS